MSILSQLGKDLPYEPRQTRWSRIRREQGRCFCGATTYGKSLCPKHLRIQAKRMRGVHPDKLWKKMQDRKRAQLGIDFELDQLEFDLARKLASGQAVARKELCPHAGESPTFKEPVLPGEHISKMDPAGIGCHGQCKCIGCTARRALEVRP